MDRRPASASSTSTSIGQGLAEARTTSGPAPSASARSPQQAPEGRERGLQGVQVGAARRGAVDRPSTSSTTSSTSSPSASRWPAPTSHPRTFETGMFNYPRGDGPAGTWDYSPTSYTPIIDAREVWWDPGTPVAVQRRTRAPTHRTSKRYRTSTDIPPGQPRKVVRSQLSGRSAKRCATVSDRNLAHRRVALFLALVVAGASRLPTTPRSASSLQGVAARPRHRADGRRPGADLPHDPHHQLRLRRHGRLRRRPGDAASPSGTRA